VEDRLQKELKNFVIIIVKHHLNIKNEFLDEKREKNQD
jgi:hypothetical protein